MAGTDEPTATIKDVIEGWLANGFIDGVYRKFRREFQVLGDADIEEAIGRVVENMLRRATPVAIRHPNAYLVKGVRYRLINALRRLTPLGLPEDAEGPAVEQTEDERLFAKELLDIIRGELARWPNRQMAVVTLTYLEAAYYGEPVDPEEIQQVVLDTLQEEITRTNVSTLLNRGRARLMAQLADKI